MRVKHKVAELEGALLDAAVAVARGWKYAEVKRPAMHHVDGFGRDLPGTLPPGAYATATEWVDSDGAGHGNRFAFNPSQDWRLGGLIIEQEGISVMTPSANPGATGWEARSKTFAAAGSTLLIAAMRVYVMATLGEEVELPF